MSSGWFRTGFVYLLILVAVAALIFSISPQSKKSEGIPITQLAEEIRNGEVKRITVTGDDSLKIEYRNRKEIAVSHKESGVGVIEILRGLGVTSEQLAAVNIEYEPPSNWGSWLTILGSVLPVLVVGALFYFLIRQAQSGNNQALSFGKSRARMFTGDKPTVTFEDVAGVEEAKEELQEVVEFLKEPEKFISLGARIPKGVLLVGAPGTGKTLLAKAVSGEAGVPFFSISGSEFVEMFVGVGASRVRDLFDQAKRNSPCLTGDAIITLANGQQVPIKGMYEQRMVGVKVPAMNEALKIEEATVIGITRRRPDDLYRITTVHSEVKATGNHLFPVLRQGRLVWVRADELQKGERVAAPRKLRTTASEHSRKSKDGNIVITGRDNLHTFIEKVGSSHPDEAARLTELNLDGSSSSRLDAIPVGNLLEEARLSIGMGQRGFTFDGRYRGHYVSWYERGQVVPSRASLQMVVEMMERWCTARGVDITPEIEALRDLAYSDMLWAKIIDIEQLEPEEYVYDLVLDRHHNFVANNITLHNCIVFVDEIDAVGRHRGAGLGGSHDEREQTLNQILVEMDGFDTDTNVIILAATNRPDILDPALLRPGRFDRRVVLDRPDMNGRKAILEVHARGKPLAAGVDLAVLAKQTPGFVGADIENLVNEAAILAARRNKKAIGMEEFQEAIERVLAGPERKSRLISDEEKEIIAYHEAGHALVMKVLPHCDPVHKVSIVSRGMVLGYTMPLPEDDRYLQHRAKFKDELAGLLGGRTAEELIFGDVTTGAANDLERATKIARKMVTEYGMSEKLGPMTFGQKEELVFLGREIGEQRDYSEAVAQEIDSEVRSLIEEAHNRAKEVLTKYRDKLEAIARRLIEVETIEAPELEALFA